MISALTHLLKLKLIKTKEQPNDIKVNWDVDMVVFFAYIHGSKYQSEYK